MEDSNDFFGSDFKGQGLYLVFYVKTKDIYIYIYIFTLFLFYLNFFFSVYILIFFPSCRSPISTIALLNFQSYSIKLTLL